MPSVAADTETHPDYRKSAREEPLPGYVLLEPLGRGGFGEVWKCEAPGGLHKAIKFVAGANSSDSASTHQFQQEFDAFLQIKSIRHPFLLTLERVELVGGDLPAARDQSRHKCLAAWHGAGHGAPHAADHPDAASSAGIWC